MSYGLQITIRDQYIDYLANYWANKFVSLDAICDWNIIKTPTELKLQVYGGLLWAIPLGCYRYGFSNDLYCITHIDYIKITPICEGNPHSHIQF